MKTLCHISDSHEAHRRLIIPDTDFLVHSGDFSYHGEIGKVKEFLRWFDSQVAFHKILIAGNHDKSFQNSPGVIKALLEEFPMIHYLENSGVELDGIKFWGSPWTPAFGYRWAFNAKRGEEIKKHWDLIPADTRVLITHGPPNGILDEVRREDWRMNHETGDPEIVKTLEHTGCEELIKKIREVKPELHLFGHIHEGYGLKCEDGVTFSNASVMDERYQQVNSPRILELHDEDRTTK